MGKVKNTNLLSAFIKKNPQTNTNSQCNQIYFADTKQELHYVALSLFLYGTKATTFHPLRQESRAAFEQIKLYSHFFASSSSSSS